MKKVIYYNGMMSLVEHIAAQQGMTIEHKEDSAEMYSVSFRTANGGFESFTALKNNDENCIYGSPVFMTAVRAELENESLTNVH